MDSFWNVLAHPAWNGIYAIFTLGLLIFAWLAARYARKQIVETTRPYVIASVAPSKASPQLFDLVIENIGRRPALDLSITLDPPPQRAVETPNLEITDIKMFTQPIAMLAPGQQMSTFYDSHIDRRGREDLPTFHNVFLAYRDSTGKTYKETSVVDIEALKGTMFVTVKTTHDIGKTLERIGKILEQSSLLQRAGAIEVEASLESRGSKEGRLESKKAANDEEYHRLKKLFGFDPDDLRKSNEK